MKAVDEKLVLKKNHIPTIAVIIGTLLYISKFLRPCFTNNPDLLFVLGFLPNFGLSFAIPFIYGSNRVRLGKPLKHFTVACIVTLLLMVANEVRDQYQSGRVFDWYDIFASLAGVIFSGLVFRLMPQKNNSRSR